MDLEDKLRILADAAKYDAACTSSGVDRHAEKGKIGNASSAGCCHSFSADGRCVTLLKVLFTNKCAYDCEYCVNRRSNDCERAEFTPRELAELTIAFFQRNYIEGLFLSSGVLRSPDHTMELMIEALRILRVEHRFNGYIHAKAIPGASPELVQQLGLLADRLSVNIELPSRESLRLLAPQKGEASVAKPMGLIRDGIRDATEMRAIARRLGRDSSARFAPAGQATQMIIGATPETDLQILRLSNALYKRFNLKRVFYSAYLPVNQSPLLPVAPTPPLEREHRLYQADWLVRFYQFEASELLDPAHPFLDTQVDPKCAWALSHLDLFPVEVNTAPYEMLLRVPGFGVRGANAIVRARRHRTLHAEDLKRLRVSLKRARFFVTVNGVYNPGSEWGGGVAVPTTRALALADDPAAIRAAIIAEQPGRDRRGRKKVDPNQMSLLDIPGAMPEAQVPVGVESAFAEQAARRETLRSHALTGKTAPAPQAEGLLLPDRRVERVAPQLVEDDAWLLSAPARREVA